MTRALSIAVGALLGALLAGCTPELGDKCVLSTDCSLRGDRTCDTSQPGGYCTIRDCRPNGCPDDGACVLFEPNIPGCSFDSRGRSRVARSYCMAHCVENADCRDNYVCVDPKAAPWFGVILDDNTGKRVCILPPSEGATGSTAAVSSSQPELPVCYGFSVDAGTIDARSAYDTGAPDGSTDGSTDAADGGADASPDAASDAGAPDASDASDSG